MRRFQLLESNQSGLKRRGSRELGDVGQNDTRSWEVALPNLSLSLADN